MITVKYLKEKIQNIPDNVFVAASEDVIEFISVANDETEKLWGIIITDNEFQDTSLIRNRHLLTGNLLIQQEKNHPWMK